MKVLGNRVACLLLVGLGAGAGGCQLIGASPKPAGSSGVKLVRYAPARDGLPKGKIWKSQIAFGDIDGDGLPDLGVVSRLADGPYIFKGDGKGHWTDASSGLPRESFCGGGMAFGDANNDGKMDVALADHCRGVFVYTGDGAGHWTNASAGLPAVGSEDVAVGDFNHDGCLDLAVVAASEEGVRAFLGDCKGVWKESSKGLANTEWGNSVVVADMNGDGNLDIIAAYSAGPRVWLGDGRGAWTEASEGLPAPDIHGLFWGIAVGDLNGDGKMDVVASDQSRGVDVFLQGDGGKYQQTSVVQCAGGVSDGKFCLTDAQCPGGTCATAICKGTCTGAVAGRSCLTDDECNRDLPRQAVQVTKATCSKGSNAGAACDRSGQNQCPGGACSAVNNSHGIPPMNALGVALGDLNNDGHTDLVVAGKTNMEEIGGVYGVFALLGDGAGNFTLLKNDGLPSGGRERTWGVGLADIDHDGVLDIGVAFGDVLSPTWRSGASRKAAAEAAQAKPGFLARLFGGGKSPEKEPAEEKPADKAEKSRGPERGFFGSIEVWRGQLDSK